jgi:formylglycine-generating enzyme required for sulfatase activity
VKEVSVRKFHLDRTPVTNAQFAAFVQKNPQWRRDGVARVFADEQYLSHWQSPLVPGKERANKPVVHVSWFAASAYCESRGARLPTWHEWEYVAAAGEAEKDARADPAWRQEILSWYSETGGKPLAEVAGRPRNAWGVHDMHGLIWEWVDDFNALLVSGDSRERDGADKLKFCGAAATSMEDRENYAVLMRTAMLSSLRGSDTTRNLGFRCAYDGEGQGR